MCGIIGIYNEQHNIVPTLIASLSHLEYRGYDSAGIAFLDKLDRINCHKMGGRVVQLKQKIAPMQLESHIGIGHTRWATHGVPNWQNAHPIFNERLAIVHNGVIENYEDLKDRLMQEGYAFRTDTDTEVLLTLISKHLNNGLKPKDAVLNSICKIKGSFAIVAIFSGFRKFMIGAKMRSPLLFGHCEGTYAVSSDVYAMPADIKQYAALDDKEMVIISADGAKVYDFSKILLDKTFIPMPCFSQNIFQKNNSMHFMLKEIEEQPEALASIIQSLYDKFSGTIKFEHLNSIATQTKKLRIIACGSSYFAGFISRNWFESMAKIPVSIELASEFCYKNFIAEENELFLFISQSGETADTIAALKKLKDLNIANLAAIVNVPNSTITKEAQYLIQTSVGPEIGVAATKSFTAQLLVLGLFAIFMALHKNTISPLAYNAALSAIIGLPFMVKETLNNMTCLDSIATLLSQSNSMIFSGRNIFYGIALEGALKMKEISYLHAEAIPAGELKHGSMALVTNNYPMLFINPYNELFYKTMSNMQEVYVRGAKIIGITNKQGSKLMGKICHKLIILPDAHEIVSPIIFSIAMQLLAYKTALLLGCDIDKPRNLAKSVTVE